MDVLHFPYGHVPDRIIESLDHHAGPDHEFQRLSPVIGRIEFGPVVQGAFIMDFHFFVFVAHDWLHSVSFLKNYQTVLIVPYWGEKVNGRKAAGWSGGLCQRSIVDCQWALEIRCSPIWF